MKITYDVALKYPDGVEELVNNLETTTLDNEFAIAEHYLDKLEATLEKIETGKRGTLRVGANVFPISDERVPRISIHVKSVIQSPSPDGLHNPEGVPVLTQTELADTAGVTRSVLAVVEKVK